MQSGIGQSVFSPVDILSPDVPSGVSQQATTDLSLVPLHFQSVTVSVTFIFICLGGVVAAVLTTLAVVAFLQRRSRVYMFVALAVGTLASKAFIGIATIIGPLSAAHHHTIEHGLDLVMGICLVCAIYCARKADHSHPSAQLSDLHAQPEESET